MDDGSSALVLGLAGIFATLAASLVPGWLSAKAARRSERRQLYASLLSPVYKFRAHAEAITNSPERHSDEPVADEDMHDLEAQVTVAASRAVEARFAEFAAAYRRWKVAALHTTDLCTSLGREHEQTKGHLLDLGTRFDALAQRVDELKRTIQRETVRGRK